MSDDQEQPKPPSRGLRSVGDALGGWARRVGELVAEVSGAPTVPDELREPLQQARSLRLSGELSQAQAILRAQVEAHPNQPHLRYALGLTFVHDLVTGGRPLRPLADVIAALQDDALGSAPRQLLQGAHDLYEGRPEPALDALRRATQHLSDVPKRDAQETRLLVHLLTGLAQLRRGHQDRALRELQKARTQLPAELGAPLRHVLLRHGVGLLLAADQAAEAEGWVDDAQEHDSHDSLARELRVRVLATKGDVDGAQAMVEALDDDPGHDETRLWVGLTVGLHDDGGDDLATIALRHLQAAPADPEHRRRWALAELTRRRAEGRELTADEGSLRRDVVQALSDAAQAAPVAIRDRYLQELAHVALRLDWFPPPVRDPILDRLRREEGTGPEELRLVRARHRIASGDRSHEDFQPGMPPRFRADPDLGGPAGPDPCSPLRDPDLRNAVLASQRALAAAERCRLEGQAELAQDLLVEALIEAPGLPRARRMLAELVQGDTGTRLEDQLTAATTLLAGVPNRILGISLAGVQTAMAQVVAARERLARPLTIAIMGEFSAGKSTFVNALLGQTVAPMGVLPTTSTINVFRRGTGTGARVHYRDGRIATLAPTDVEPFLHGLDDSEAARIRHVEIERTGGRMGEASVVDTPGLNALDAFHEQVAREFLDEADAVVWLFSATRSGAATEAGMLQSLRAGGRQVLGVLNKVDTLDDSEKTELADYLRKQLGEVLVEVVPLCARDALEYRATTLPAKAGSAERKGNDPFAAVEAALERHFLQRARELKRSLTARRLGEALVGAREAVVAAIDALEHRADATLQGMQGERVAAHPLLLRFGDALEEQLLGIDDLLTREGLSLGVLVAGKGRAKGPLDPQDVEYLASSFREAGMAALRRALAPLGREDPAAAHVLDEQLVPWVQGHVEGLVHAGFIEALLREQGDKISEGEAAMRAGFREGLRPVARAWAGRARQLAREVERARARLDREASSAPRAEALRLRSAVLTAIDALAQGVHQGEGEGAA
ncbi:dynamin family protein [Paraliomyxa miuraensis]|uniref:dynamin family protein n=1 Tax=Paraliomyxa miuraensis TaxID=376150 RepID=UPI00224E118D|nr:dynamin family protein [Paraliomyxa miuraensis]MCX4248069.1 dynamin family protein [Paraliomyxa miuraensis]